MNATNVFPNINHMSLTISLADSHRGEGENLPVLRTKVCQQRHVKGPHPQPHRSVSVHGFAHVTTGHHPSFRSFQEVFRLALYRRRED